MGLEQLLGADALATKPHQLKLIDLYAKYPFYEFEDLVRHPAVVYIPYFYNSVKFSELYSMNIPLFTPSLKLLMELDWTLGLMHMRIYWPQLARARHRDADPTMPPPNDVRWNSTLYWLALSEQYEYKHVQYFDSAQELHSSLRSARLDLVSESMREHNLELAEHAFGVWADVLQHKVLANAPDRPRDVPSDFDGAMDTLYGAHVGAEPSSCDRMYKIESQVGTHTGRLQELRRQPRAQDATRTDPDGEELTRLHEHGVRHVVHGLVCAGTELAASTTDSLSSCARECAGSRRCSYFAYWRTCNPNRCKIYAAESCRNQRAASLSCSDLFRMPDNATQIRILLE